MSAIRSAIRSGARFLVDRSPYEDAEVFARYWAARGGLDDRGLETYNAFAQLLWQTVPPPALLVYCRANPETCVQRLAERPRPYQALYPPDHLHRLHELYETWRASYDLSPVLVVDSEIVDFRRPAAVADIAGEVLARVAAPVDAHEQLLFPMPDLPAPASIPSLARSSTFSTGPRRGRPLVYVAAAFTSQEATAVVAEGQHFDQLWAPEGAHGVIPPGRYRQRLLAIADAFSDLGYDAILPHRDVNAWGRKVLSAQEAVTTCLDLVASADLFFGILGMSYGSHAETAKAMALGIPTVIVAVGDEETFFGRGLRLSRNVVSLKVSRLEDLPALVRSGHFLDRFMLQGNH